MKKNNKIVIISFIILSIIYFIGVILFSEFSYPGTRLNGNDKSFVLLNNIFNYNTNNESNLNFKIEGRNSKELTISLNDIELNKKIKNVDKQPIQNSWIWPVDIFKNHNYKVEYDISYNKKKLEKILSESKLFNSIKEPVDAKIEYNGTDYIITKHDLGDKLDKDKTLISIEDAIRNGETKLILDKQYINPKVLSDSKQLDNDLKKIKTISNLNYIFDFEDRKYELNGKDIFQMYDLVNDKYVLNKEKIEGYVIKIARETNTYAKEHKFKATGLGEITVPGGIYGWKMDVDKTVENIIKMINEYKDGKVEIAYEMEAKHRGKNDIGNTYIEIDLSRQHMWFYKDGKLVIDTDIISGDARSRNAATPTGVNKVWSKERGKDLIGANEITGEKYVYPVEYWMPVGWTGSGIHDTSTRKEYGGNIYKTWGSSSCINTPPSVMKIIFENVPINTAVVIYESSTNLSPTEFEKQEMIRKGEAKVDVS
ncbi:MULTISPECIES: L,D-transpeptidase family protein [Helcococcus]|uniref:Peptidoglycan binding domain-containing protein n=1 Tax=Helcococcus bovis TaxID=3153252 RepID=A0ABW9F7V0_9FIRM